MKKTWINEKLHSLSNFVTGTELNRIGRIKYFSRGAIISVIFHILFSMVMAFESSVTRWILGIPLIMIILFFGICLCNKRLHDRGFSGWWQLLILIPFVNFIVLLCLWLVPGNKGNNNYGEPSKSKKREKIVSIVIPLVYFILILIAAFLPMMQSDSGRVRDVSRHISLSQIQSAIVVYQGYEGKWPGMDAAKNRIPVSNIKSNLLSVGFSSVPKDPSNNQDYMYMVLKRNNIDNGGFILMANTESEGGSNWIICDNGEGYIKSQTDLINIKLCNRISKGKTCYNSNGICTYTSADQLRYILTY